MLRRDDDVVDVAKSRSRRRYDDMDMIVKRWGGGKRRRKGAAVLSLLFLGSSLSPFPSDDYQIFSPNGTRYTICFCPPADILSISLSLTLSLPLCALPPGHFGRERYDGEGVVTILFSRPLTPPHTFGVVVVLFCVRRDDSDECLIHGGVREDIS